MRIKRFLVLALAAAMLLSSAAMAAGNLLRGDTPVVVYDGGTGAFTLENAVGGDLFPNFKGIMPGDERAQDITLVTRNLTAPVAIYLTSTPSAVDGEGPDPLAPLTVSVTRDGAPLEDDFAHSVLEQIPLGVFEEDGSAVLHVTLKAPVTVGNELQNAEGALRWDFIARDPNVIFIRPASISSYVGGVSSNDSGAPTLRFHVQLPNGVIWDDANGKPIEMTLHRDGEEDIKMTPRKVEGSDNYYCFPTLERGLKFVDGNKVLKGDYLTLTDQSDPNSRSGSYAVGLVSDPAWHITAYGPQSGRSYTVEVIPGSAKVYVRYVSNDEEMIGAPSSALTKVVSDPAKVNTIVDAGGGVIYRKAVAVIPENATYYTNGKDSGLGSFTLNQSQDREGDSDGLKPPLVALLFDDTVSLSDDLTDKLIEAKMIEHAGHAQSCGAAEDYSFDGWNYNFRYLDLVNYNDGNAWVSTSSPITIYWPYPEEALSNPGAYEYQILHYRKMSRSYAHKAITDIDAWENELLHNGEKGPVQIVKEDLRYHEKEKGISFTLEYTDGTGDNFSPFVLMWRKKGGSTPIPGGGDSDDDINLTVEKKWLLDDGGKASESVTVALFRDGKEYATATLNEANGWKKTWYGLNPRRAWAVEERNVPEGFAVSIRQKGWKFTITNDDRPASPTPSPLPSPTPSGGVVSPAPSGEGAPSPVPSGEGAPSPAPSGEVEISPVPSGEEVISPAPSGGDDGQTASPRPDPAASPAPGGAGSGSGTNGSGGSGSGDGDRDTTLPQTGQQWWPVAVMAIGGTALLVVGLKMGKKGKHEA